MTPQQAHDMVVGVHNQAFFGYLASHGVQPQTEKEAQDLLSLAGMLASANVATPAPDSRFGGVKQALAKTLGIPDDPVAPGFQKQAEPNQDLSTQFHPSLIDGANQAAAELMAYPEMLEAVYIKQAELYQQAS